MSGVLHAASVPVLGFAALVIVVGVARAVATRGWGAAVALGSALSLGLEFLLAAGLLRLSGSRLPALGVVALVILVRQLIVRGIRQGESAVAGAGSLSRPRARSRA